jgi:DNA polymerase III delta prime subunit
MAKLATQFFKRVTFILEAEGVEFDKAVVAEVINKHFPDWRRVLNELQRYSATGKIDSGILANMTEASIKDLIKLMKDKNFLEVRKWVKNNLDTDVNYLYNQFYDISAEAMTPINAAQLVLILAQYQYQNAFSANPEINFMAFLVEVMKECEFN